MRTDYSLEHVGCPQLQLPVTRQWHVDVPVDML